MDSSKQKNSLFSLSRTSRCHGCDIKLEVDTLVKLTNPKEEKEVYCLTCAGLKDYILLKKGDSKLTRLAKKYSSDSYVVLKWSELWKTYERLGLLVEQSALNKAREESDN